MTNISISRFRRSLSYARQGLARAWRHENNFRIHVVVGTIVIIAMVLLRVSMANSAVVLFLISTLVALELVNTLVERFVNLLEPRIHPYARDIKDLMAASILVMSIAAAVIGLLIFIPRIIAVIHGG